MSDVRPEPLFSLFFRSAPMQAADVLGMAGDYGTGVRLSVLCRVEDSAILALSTKANVL
jgi:hypothetical protein